MAMFLYPTTQMQSLKWNISIMSKVFLAASYKFFAKVAVIERF